MESNKYNIENFERFLREKTDEFRMYPSKRVWYSIYNNMHPGNRLPSVSMSVILIGFLFLIGYLNTTDATKGSDAFKQDGQSPAQFAAVSNYGTMGNTQSALIPSKEHFFTSTNSKVADLTKRSTFIHSHNSVSTTNIQNRSFAPSGISHTPLTVSTGKANITITNSVAENISSVAEEKNPQESYTDYPSAAGNVNAIAVDKNVMPEEYSTQVASNTVVSIKEIVSSNNEKVAVAEPANTATIAITPAEKETVSATDAKEEKKAEPTTTEDNTANKNSVAVSTNNKNEFLLANKAWIEDFALHNKPVAKKWAGKLSLQAYITPSVVYRKLKNNAADKQLAGTNNNYNNFNADAVVKQRPSFGIETGFSLQYDISKNIRLKGGAQFNYTRYNAFAFETNHPIATTLTMNYEDEPLTYEVYRTSNYSNISGFYSTKLHNETYQLSLPIGVDYKLASFTDNISWYAGVTAQPTIILFAKSYVISADRRSYVHDPSLLNRFNLNAGFETYLSYKTNNGYTLQFGPQYRTQIFSTNTKLYSVEERLQNFGIKVGITKRL